MKFVDHIFNYDITLHQHFVRNRIFIRGIHDVQGRRRTATALYLCNDSSLDITAVTTFYHGRNNSIRTLRCFRGVLTGVFVGGNYLFTSRKNSS